MVPALDPTRVHLLKKQEQIQMLSSEKQVNAILETQVPLLHTRQLKFLREKTLIQKVDPQWIDYLHVAAVPHIPKSYLPHLTDKTLIQAIDSRDFDHLSEDQKKYLSPPQISLIRNPAHIKSLQDYQVPHIHPSMVPHLQDDRLKLLISREHLENVDDQRVPLLQGKNCVENIPAKKVPYLHTTEYSHLMHQDQINQIPPEHINLISPTQASLLTDPTRIRKLTEPRLIGSLKGKYAEYVNPDVNPNVDPDHPQSKYVNMISPLAFPFLPDTLLNEITSLNRLNYLKTMERDLTKGHRVGEPYKFTAAQIEILKKDGEDVSLLSTAQTQTIPPPPSDSNPIINTENKPPEDTGSNSSSSNPVSVDPPSENNPNPTPTLSDSDPTHQERENKPPENTDSNKSPSNPVSVDPPSEQDLNGSNFTSLNSNPSPREEINASATEKVTVTSDLKAKPTQTTPKETPSVVNKRKGPLSVLKSNWPIYLAAVITTLALAAIGLTLSLLFYFGVIHHIGIGVNVGIIISSSASGGVMIIIIAGATLHFIIRSVMESHKNKIV